MKRNKWTEKGHGIKAFAALNETRLAAIHELGHYWVGEHFDFLGLWVAIDTPQCAENYPEIRDWLDDRNLDGCCRWSRLPNYGDFADYCAVMAGTEAQRLFLEEHGYRGAAYRRWRKHHYDAARANSSCSAMTDREIIEANPLSGDPFVKWKATALIRQVLTQFRSEMQEMTEILLKQGALIFNPKDCPICQQAGYQINYHFPKW